MSITVHTPCGNCRNISVDGDSSDFVAYRDGPRTWELAYRGELIGHYLTGRQLEFAVAAHLKTVEG